MRKVLWMGITAAVALSCGGPVVVPIDIPPLTFRGPIWKRKAPVELEFPEATSPKLVLDNVQMTFNRRDFDCDFDRFKEMLGRSFVFYFDPDDVDQKPPGKNYRIPESWSYTKFCKAVRNLFEQPYCVSLDINTGTVGAPGENETTYRAENVTLSFIVYVIEPSGFRAGDYGYCNFAFERYDGKGGKKLWRLTRWWDRTAAPYGDVIATSRPASVGSIFAFYR